MDGCRRLPCADGEPSVSGRGKACANVLRQGQAAVFRKPIAVSKEMKGKRCDPGRRPDEGQTLLGLVGHDEELGIYSTCHEKLLEIYAVRCHHLICITEWMCVFSFVSAPLSFFSSNYYY